MSLEEHFCRQQFANGYELVNGATMHAELGERFHIPHPVFKRNIGVGHFVELRIDSPRFTAHPDAPVNCTCPHCNEPATKPILCHEEPASLLKIPRQPVPSRGWGEQFWARIAERSGPFLRAVIDNLLYESRLHGLNEGDEVILHEDHILAFHCIHNEDILLSLSESDLLEFGRWVLSQRS